MKAASTLSPCPVVKQASGVSAAVTARKAAAKISSPLYAQTLFVFESVTKKASAAYTRNSLPLSTMTLVVLIVETSVYLYFSNSFGSRIELT